MYNPVFQAGSDGSSRGRLFPFIHDLHEFPRVECRSACGILKHTIMAELYDMTFKVSDFRNDVRGVLGDLGTDRHHSDTDIDFAVVDGIRRMRSVRPDSRYVNGVLVDYEFPTDADDIADFHVAFDPRWRLGVVYYAAYRRFECDVVDAVNRELASSYLKQSDAVFAS